MVIDWTMSSLLHTELEGWVLSGAKIMICLFQELLLLFVGLLAMAYQACQLLWQGFFWRVEMAIHYNTKNVCIAWVPEQRSRDFKCSFSCFAFLWVWGTCSLAKYKLLSCVGLFKNPIVSLAILPVMKALPLPSDLFLLPPHVNFFVSPQETHLCLCSGRIWEVPEITNTPTTANGVFSRTSDK